jgi:hypothetical protein
MRIDTQEAVEAVCQAGREIERAARRAEADALRRLRPVGRERSVSGGDVPEKDKGGVDNGLQRIAD